MKKELQSILGIVKYLIKFSLVSAEMFQPLPKLTSLKTDWKWNRMHHNLYEKGKASEKHACMKVCDAARPLYLEVDVSAIGLRARLLQVRDSMNCRHHELRDNAILSLTAFVSKSGNTTM